MNSPGRVLALCFMTQACGAGWRQPPGGVPHTLPVRQQVQIWRDDEALRWHAVGITEDLVSGIPFHQPVDCDTCRLSIPRATVDSFRLGNPTAGFWKTFALVVGIPTAAWMILCSTSETGGPPCTGD